MSAPLDDEILERIVRTLARTHLEVERGLRSVDSFAHQMPPAARLPYLQGNTPNTRLAGGPVHDTDIRTVRVERHDNGRIYATAVTSTQPGRAGALTFVLETRDDKVALLQATRLQTRGDYTRTTGGPTPSTTANSDRQRDVIRDSRDHAEAARRNLARTLDTTAHDDPHRGDLQRDHDTWTQLHRHYADQYQQHQQHRSPNPIRDRRRH